MFFLMTITPWGCNKLRRLTDLSPADNLRVSKAWTEEKVVGVHASGPQNAETRQNAEIRPSVVIT